MSKPPPPSFPKFVFHKCHAYPSSAAAKARSNIEAVKAELQSQASIRIEAKTAEASVAQTAAPALLSLTLKSETTNLPNPSPTSGSISESDVAVNETLSKSQLRPVRHWSPTSPITDQRKLKGHFL
ncbi:unnamed protein product [Cuscuta campestris]|uniref:Uncharacterized protein n=1 Tax=Cuscuta campestris TaxID=132261 RepID=A0A484MJJ6_9ASTE|nr:unnamed protein product [Cuscuta campestris]